MSRLPQAAFDEARVPQRLRWHWQSLVRHGGVALALPKLLKSGSASGSAWRKRLER